MCKVHAEVMRDSEGLWSARVTVDRTSWVTESRHGSRRGIRKTIYRFVEAMGIAVSELVVDEVECTPK